MFKKIVSLIFIFELLIMITLCTTITDHMSNINVVTKDALNGNSKPAADLFTSMRNDLEKIPIKTIGNISIKIKEIIINKIPDFINNIWMKYIDGREENNILYKK